MLKQSTVETVIEKVVGKVVNSSSFGDGFFALAEKDGGLQLVAVTQGESPLAERWKAEKSIEDMCRDSWRWQKQNPSGYEG